MRASGGIIVTGVIDGKDGNDGNNGTSVYVLSTSVMYATTSSYVAPSTLSEDKWSSTYPTSLSEGTWLYTRTIVTYSDGKSTTTYSSSYVGKNGTDAFVVDLTNQADIFGTDSNGDTLSDDQVRTTKIHIYLGTAKQTMTANPTVSLVYASSGSAVPSTVAEATTLTGNGTTEGTIGITIHKNQNITDTIYVDITAYCAKGNPTARFTLAPQKSGAAGVSPEIWQLLPSRDSISFARDTDGKTLTPSQVNVTVYAKKTVGSTITKYTSQLDNVYVKVGYDDTAADTLQIGGSVSVSNEAYLNYRYLRLELYVNNVHCDTEAIPILIDGEKGNAGNDGKYYVKEYACSTSRTSHADSDILGGAAGWSSTQPAPTTRYPYVWERSRLYDPSTDTYGEWTYVCLTGADGQSITGATGKMCYIAGEYNDTFIYTSNDKQTVAVEMSQSDGTVELWYLTAATNVVDGVHYAPVDGSPYWEKGLNEFNLIRTRYLFADFAKLGSFVVSGDWFYSQFGSLVDTESSVISIDSEQEATELYDGKVPYMYFDSSDPMAREDPDATTAPYKFGPNLAIDAMTGKIYALSAYVKGEVYMNNGVINLVNTKMIMVNNQGGQTIIENGKIKTDFLDADQIFANAIKGKTIDAENATINNLEVSGTIRSNVSYSPTTVLEGNGTINIDLSTHTSNIKCSAGTAAVLTMVLPSPETYDGLEMTFFFPVKTRSVGSCVINYSGGIMYKNSSSALLVSATSLGIIGNQIVRIRAIDGTWYVVEGSVEAV